MRCLHQVFVCGTFFLYLVFLTSSTDVDGDLEDDYDDYDLLDYNTTTNGTLVFVKELSNVTRNEGKTVKLRCEVKSLDPNVTSKVRITWKKNEAILDENDPRIKTTEKPESQLFVSRLRISNVVIHDRGFYDCIASNRIEKIRSQAFLEIANTKWSGPNELPTVKPLVDGTIGISSDGDLTTFYPHAERKGRGEELAAIYPTVNNDQLVGSTSLFEKTPTPPLIYNSSIPFCQKYTGDTCKTFLGNNHVFVQPPFAQDDIEAKVVDAWVVVSQSNEISKNCQQFALPSLCFSAFPKCLSPAEANEYQKSKFRYKQKTLTEDDSRFMKNIRSQVSGFLQRICREECELLENELCRREYAIAVRHPVIKQILELEKCNALPKEGDHDSVYCLSLGVGRAQNVNEDDTCFWDYGESYRGTKDTTASGKKCMRWAHVLHVALSEHPELSGHSYCRNPGRQDVEPFCYIEQNIKEVCGLPFCATVIWMYIAVVAGVFFMVVFFALCCYCCRQRKNKNSRLQNMNVPTVDKNIYGNTGPNSPMEMNTLLPRHPNNIPPLRGQNTTKSNNAQTVPHYTYKEVQFVEELGEGAFGKVYKGELKTKSGRTIVAVKSLKENASAKTQADFQREIDLISELRHPNIICLLGVVVKQEPMCMLFEFMSEGDLHEFLIANSPNEGRSLSQHQFLHIAVQIAQGMDYLSENHYVHRDLAARNCLVSKDMVVKISDFGLSRDMYSCDYYRVQSKSLLPVRWMPPESILYGKFTTESDVWSYGVVLWEIYSYGLQPYYGYNNQEVINMIRSRKMLPCPDVCPSYCYALMVECWAELAIRRPGFGEIVHRLKMWRQNGSSSGAYFKTPEVHTNLQKPHNYPVNNDPPSAPPEPAGHHRKPGSSKLHDSQSSLTSHNSSLGNRTQSTSLSNEHGRSGRRVAQQKFAAEPVSPRNMVVNANGESFETKLSF